MRRTAFRSTRRVVVLVAASLILGMMATAAAADRPDPEGFYVPPPNHGAKQQIAELTSQGDKASADLIRNMIKTPQAVWFTAGTPESVLQDVRNTVKRAAAKKTVPVLVAYNIPFRDCAQFSAGGATTSEEYEAWIDAIAAGIGSHEAIVILEPDGLGIIPWYDPYGSADGSAGLEWCQPAEADPDTAAAERFAMLNHAVGSLKAQPNTSVYLDGTHSAWLGTGDIAHRLVQAGVADADGFYLNASNYQFTTNGVQYGNWISACLAIASDPAGFVECPNQYWNGGPPGTKIADLRGPWDGVALSPYGEWSDDTDVEDLNTSGINARYEGANPTTGFVVDTSRNGQGPWAPDPSYPDGQDWCNPPDRGLGLAPTTDTGADLVDAFLWIKIPGESDGECTRGLGQGGETVDPEWGIVDPGAGAWFPEMALDLAENAVSSP